jgi:hypothetical protein
MVTPRFTIGRHHRDPGGGDSITGMIEPAEAVHCLIPDDIPFEDLVIQGLQNRPGLAQSKELVQARLDYLDSVILHNRAQFRLKRAIGQQP